MAVAGLEVDGEVKNGWVGWMQGTGLGRKKRGGLGHKLLKKDKD